MKKQILSLVAILLIAGISNNLMAQTTNTHMATADARATIVAPITITWNNVNLEFGSIIAGNGWVKVAAADDARTFQVAAMNPGDQGDTPSAAQFTVGGSTTYGFDITLPADGVVTLTNGTDTMAVNTFESSEGTTSALVAGTKDFNVGATLVVTDAKSSGLYTGTFDVTVAYN